MLATRTAQTCAESAEDMLVRLVNQYQLPLLRMCYLYLHDAKLAEDAVQETFLKAYRAAGQFCGDCSEKSWLVRIAMNTCCDMKRTAWFRRIDRRITPDDLPQAACAPQADEALADAISRLPEKSRRVVLMYYYHDMTLAEIAAALGLAVSSVSERLKKARAQLRAALGEEEFHGR